MATYNKIRARSIKYDPRVSKLAPRVWCVTEMYWDFEEDGSYTTTDLKKIGKYKEFGTPDAARTYAESLYDFYHKKHPDIQVRMVERLLDIAPVETLQKKLDNVNHTIDVITLALETAIKENNVKTEASEYVRRAEKEIKGKKNG